MRPLPKCVHAVQNVTDIVVLVVSANDSIMPQTIEAINHAKGRESTFDCRDQQNRPDTNPQKIGQTFI